ncbi:MAG TPA: hypothetical protein VKE22_00385 [Haliangiales bacterium]|nr:hypothetical protein [Haliangiales bacterium]
MDLVPAVKRLVDTFGVPGLERGVEQLQAALVRLWVEALDAEAKGRSLTDAAEDDATFPALHRLHLAVHDILTMSLPPELQGWARAFLARPDHGFFDELQRGLGRLAASDGPARALGRVLLYQAVRLNLMIAEHLSGSSIASVGGQARDLDLIAEAEVARWIEHASAAPPGDERPLELLVAAGLTDLGRHLEDLKDVVRRVDEDLVSAFRLRAELELKLRQMDAADAVLIRNAFAPALDEQRREVDALRESHPMLLGERSRDAIDQQVSRLRRRIAGEDWPERRRKAIIDLIAEAEEEADE